MTDRGTFGPAYDATYDQQRVSDQHARIREFMGNGHWYTLAEISGFLGYPEASVSAQLRHLRKPKFGGWLVEKRRRVPNCGTWEYRVLSPVPNGQCCLAI